MTSRKRRVGVFAIGLALGCAVSASGVQPRLFARLHRDDVQLHHSRVPLLLVRVDSASPNFAWGVSFGDGGMNGASKTTLSYVRAVR